jgi:putative peptidoglycan lipid II flippase
LLRSVSATFLARGDTATPVKALFASVVVNVALKILLMGPLAQVGLAFGTSAGVWVNFLLLLWFAHRAGLFAADARLKASAGKLAVAGIVLVAALWAGERWLVPLFSGWTRLGDVAALAVLAGTGAVAYFGTVALLFGRGWFRSFANRRGPGAGQGRATPDNMQNPPGGDP